MYRDFYLMEREFGDSKQKWMIELLWNLNYYIGLEQTFWITIINLYLIIQFLYILYI